MAKINLLPWREELREQKQQDFIALIGLGVAITSFLFLLGYLQIESLITHQKSRNQMLDVEISIVDKKIKEIKDIEDKKSKLLTKIDVIQTLQESRPQIVHLFDELAKSTPEGIFLTQFKQKGKSLAVSGKAQSNARVSAYMRGIDASPWLKSPVLQVIKGKNKGKNKVKSGELNDFSMLAQQGTIKQKEGKK